MINIRKKNIKYLVMDVDGTLTDGKIYMGQTGELFKAFNIKDGCGIHDIALSAGLIPLIITGRESEILVRRCKEIGIDEIYQNVSDKVAKLRECVKDFSRVAFIGDDINDLMCMKVVQMEGGIIGCPADAVKKVLEIADFVAEHDGGDGAIRDSIEWLTENENC